MIYKEKRKCQNTRQGDKKYDNTCPNICRGAKWRCADSGQKIVIKYWKEKKSVT
jgi:hypothetical protein